MPQLLYAAELTPDSPVETIVVDEYNFCELSRAVLSWQNASSAAQWLIEVSPGPGRDFFAVCRLTTTHPEACISCIALPDGALRLVAVNDEARAAKGVQVHVSGDFDPTGELESFYAVTCTGSQDWKISPEVEFFETFSVVVKTPELVRKHNRAYVQIHDRGRWVNVAHIPGDKMWVLVKDRLVVKGDKLRCIVVGPDANVPYKWDAVTTLDDFSEKSDDDRDTFLAEAEEVSSCEDRESTAAEAPNAHLMEEEPDTSHSSADRLEFAIGGHSAVEPIEVEDSDNSFEVDASPSKRQRVSTSEHKPAGGAASQRRNYSPEPDENSPEQKSTTSPASRSPPAAKFTSARAARKAMCTSAHRPAIAPQNVQVPPAKPVTPSKVYAETAKYNSGLSGTAKSADSKEKVARLSGSSDYAKSPVKQSSQKAVAKSQVAAKQPASEAPSKKVSPMVIEPGQVVESAGATAGKSSGPKIEPKKKSESTRPAVEVAYLNELRAIIRQSGPCRLSALGSRVKKPAGVQKLVDFLKSSGEFEIKNTDVVTLKKK